MEMCQNCGHFVLVSGGRCIDCGMVVERKLPGVVPTRPEPLKRELVRPRWRGMVRAASFVCTLSTVVLWIGLFSATPALAPWAYLVALHMFPILAVALAAVASNWKILDAIAIGIPSGMLLLTLAVWIIGLSSSSSEPECSTFEIQALSRLVVPGPLEPQAFCTFRSALPGSVLEATCIGLPRRHARLES